MATQDLSSSEILAQFSRRSRWILDSMVQMPQAFEITNVELPERDSSMGLLDRLPVEVLHCIMMFTDLFALTRFSQTSYLSRLVVMALPAFRDLRKHVPKVLVTLGKAGIADLHSLLTLHQALRMTKCVSCKRHGAFVFLITYERCCYDCLRRNQRFWASTVTDVYQRYPLSTKKVRSLPKFRPIPGRYPKVSIKETQSRTRLVSLKMARELAVSTHKPRKGSPPPDLIHQSNLEWEWDMVNIFRTSPAGHFGVDPQSQIDPSTVPILSRGICNRYDGAAIIELPYLSDAGELEIGHWCWGCHWLSEGLWRGTLSRGDYPDIVFSTESQRAGRRIARLDWSLHARSKTEFLEHARHCRGISAYREYCRSRE